MKICNSKCIEYKMNFVCILVVIIIFILLINFVFYRKLYHSDNIIEGNQYINANKLMIVAHPDDELIFGGKELLTENGWKVVCITNGSPKSENIFALNYSPNRRLLEFINVMNTLGCQYEMWDYEDNGYNSNWDESSLLHKLNRLINEKKYKMILTHNLDGEYGHIQHKKVSELVHKLNPSNLYVFGYVDKKHIGTNKYLQTNPYANQVKELLTLYSSQENTIHKYYVNIMYQSINKSIM
ncbi:hypothetical protein QJ857_gp0853 [Tupanvirus soda lake]|uniref:N-acetylglucosaminylphosphatidylinositol deacetylase n=2 Tax=Tupanvirus TaxID=2094720 RepID=A0A6N1NRM6_9VIRU|nr:hypothetical protein QJ857_gp0853 [Tupanvirus soda lake]QKU35197.1 hypothetical protein [Tupanvirus soda lake]